ncbi:MAG: Cof-type HAD-IIB family hydrolase [Erysipelotrichaceae bacterium]|nr:Cof-type HAD-IIB family hydrolase [Erysipelotrichaceae bacterium]
MNYKIVFCDLDGTLLNSNHQLSTSNANTIKNLPVPFIAVSARMPKGITCFTDQLGIDCPICAYNGAYIFHHDRIINNVTIPYHLVKDIAAALKDTTAHLSIYQSDEWYIEKNDIYSKNEAQITNITPSVVDFSKTDLSNVNKLLVISSLDDIDAITASLQNYRDQVTIVKSKPDYVEIMPKGTSKQEAIRLILEYYSLEAHQAIAIGDNYNDEPMIGAVGRGILLANAPGDLRAIYETSQYTNDQDGVSKILEQLILKK